VNAFNIVHVNSLIYSYTSAITRIGFERNSNVPVTTQLNKQYLRALTVSLGILMLVACSTIDIGGPRANKRNPQAGILQLASGKQIAVLPELLNYTGAGTYTWPNGRKQDGNWQAGQLQGIGREETARETYIGQWHDGRRHGHGELTKSNGDHYVGDFVTGLAEGKGTQTSSDGVFRGTWRAGQQHGQGQFNHSNGGEYQGQWFNGYRDGYGQEKYNNGAIYQGDWLADKPHGFGRYYYVNAASYEGSWDAGQRQGYGSWVSPADVRYDGTWRADKKHGFGKERRPDGSYYAGQWHASQRHGEGSEVHADGSMHSGLWQHDVISGPGHRTSRAGITIAGSWLQNTITQGSLSLPDDTTYNGGLFSPDGRSVDPSLVSWLTVQAGADNHHAQYFLATAYLDFQDPAPDPTTAQVWLQRAADAGLAEAQFRLSVLLLEHEAQTSVVWLEKAAAQQHPLANQVLGEYLHTGVHFPQNFAGAITLYQRAADKGNVVATNNLAWLLATVGDNAFADPQRAIDLIRPYVLYLGDWQHLDTLAAAHARLGDTELAAKLQKQALLLAQTAASAEVILEMTHRLNLYSKSQAYIE
jgi:TPR repeat protein